MSTNISAAAAAAASTLSGVPTLVQPTVVEALDAATGLVSVGTADVGITLRCTLGQFSDNGDWIEVQRQDLRLPLPNWTTIHGPEQFNLPASGDTIDVSIPAPADTGGFVDGRYQLRHLLFVNQFGDPSVPGDLDRPGDLGEFSAGAPFTIDRIAPYARAGTRDQPSAPLYTGTLPAGMPITQSFLDANGGLPFTIPDNAYALPSGQWAAGDTVKYYWSPNLIPLPEHEVEPNPTRPFQPAGNTYTVPASAITTSGLWNFFYVLTDRAGNESRPSLAASFTVALLPVPVLDPIFIPLAPAPEGGSIDDLLHIADYVAGIEAQVRTYNFQPGLDQIQLRWGTQPFTPLSPTFTTLPLVFNNLNQMIRDEYANRRGPQPVDVQYRVVRNGEPFDSPVKTVNVDLSVAGPENPGEPGTVNPRLSPAQFFGQTSVELNTLREVDANLPITVSIVLWSDPDLPGPGQFIIVRWSDGTLAPAFELTNELPGSTVTFTIPWSLAAATGNGLQNVSYFIASTRTPTPSDNRNPAPDTQVNVIDAVTLSMAPPQFLRFVGTGANAQWTCDSLGPRPQTNPTTYDGQIFVPGDARFIIGEQLTLSVRVFTPRTGAIRDEDTQAFRQTITAAIQASGFTFAVPFALLRVARLGRGEATSTTMLAGNVNGRGFAAINVRSVLSQTYCDLSAVPPLP